MSEKHSPTPWTQCGMNIIGADHTVVCTVNRPPGDNTADAFRDQEFIVRAVNCHEELLAAQPIVEAARELLNNLIDCDEHGPELGCDKNKYPLDQAGDPWYSDCWKLYQAFNTYDAITTLTPCRPRPASRRGRPRRTNMSTQDEKEVSRLKQINEELLAACEAHAAWAWAEHNHAQATFHERMELSQYAEWLTQRALLVAAGCNPESEKYRGVPQLIVWPGVNLSQIGADDARMLVSRLLAAYRAAIAKAEGRTTP